MSYIFALILILFQQTNLCSCLTVNTESDETNSLEPDVDAYFDTQDLQDILIPLLEQTSLEKTDLIDNQSDSRKIVHLYENNSMEYHRFPRMKRWRKNRKFSTKVKPNNKNNKNSKGPVTIILATNVSPNKSKNKLKRLSNQLKNKDSLLLVSKELSFSSESNEEQVTEDSKSLEKNGDHSTTGHNQKRTDENNSSSIDKNSTSSETDTQSYRKEKNKNESEDNSTESDSEGNDKNESSTKQYISKEHPETKETSLKLNSSTLFDYAVNSETKEDNENSNFIEDNNSKSFEVNDPGAHQLQKQMSQIFDDKKNVIDAINLRKFKVNLGAIKKNIVLETENNPNSVSKEHHQTKTSVKSSNDPMTEKNRNNSLFKHDMTVEDDKRYRKPSLSSKNTVIFDHDEKHATNNHDSLEHSKIHTENNKDKTVEKLSGKHSCEEKAKHYQKSGDNHRHHDRHNSYNLSFLFNKK